MTHRFNPAVLRDYDIRGPVGEGLDETDAYAVGRSFATLLQRAGGHRVVVGRDGRTSSPQLEEALVKGLRESGVDAVRIGLSATPMLYFAEASAPDVQGGIQVTGSHNPANHNGFKMVLEGRPFFGDDIQRLGQVAAAGDWVVGEGGEERRDILAAYVDRLLVGLAGISHDRLAAFRIGWDAGNGAAGPAVELLTQKLPGEHHLLFTSVDGTFPNHHPDPTVEANLADLQALVAAKQLDFGVAFDGDADRIGVIDAQGRVIWGDQLIMIFARDLLARVPGATVIADVKASAVLFDLVSRLGGRPVMWKSGHSQIKSKMKETGALLAGEMSGHLFFGHEWYGFDDALFAAVQLIAASVRLGQSVTAMHDGLPQVVNTPELRFVAPEERKFAAIDEVAARLQADGADFNALDGVRVTTHDGWWLLRASNTQAALVARAESATPAGLQRLLDQIDDQLAQSGLRREGAAV